MILKNDIPKTCSYTRMIFHSLQHFKALQLHIGIITAITIRLWARDFYEVIVDEAEGRINYGLIEIESE